MFDLNKDKIVETLATFGGNAAAIESIKEAVSKGKTVVIVSETHVDKTVMLRELIHAIPNEKKVTVVASEREFRADVPDKKVIDWEGTDLPKVMADVRIELKPHYGEERNMVLVWDAMEGAAVRYNVSAWSEGLQGLATVTSKSVDKAIELLATYYIGGFVSKENQEYKDVVRQICNGVDLFVSLDDDMVIREISKFDISDEEPVKRTLLSSHRPEVSEYDKAFKVIEKAAKKGDTILIVGCEGEDTSGLFKEVVCILTDNKPTYLYKDADAMGRYLKDVDSGLLAPISEGSAVAVEGMSDIGMVFAMNVWGNGYQGLGLLHFLDGVCADALESFIRNYMKVKGLDAEDYKATRKEVCDTIDIVVMVNGSGEIEEISKPNAVPIGDGAKREVIYYHPNSEYAEYLKWEENKNIEEPEVKHSLDKEKVMERLSMELEALKVKTKQSELEGRPQLAFVTDALANEYKRLMELFESDEYRVK
ncbi:hypothetical protein [Bacillus sp. NEAU-Y102]